MHHQQNASISIPRRADLEVDICEIKSNAVLARMALDNCGADHPISPEQFSAIRQALCHIAIVAERGLEHLAADAGPVAA